MSGTVITIGLEGISSDNDTEKADRTQKGESLLALPTTYTVVDLETTGLDPQWNDIIEYGAMRVTDGVVTAKYTQLVNPGYEIDDFITKLTGITTKCSYRLLRYWTYFPISWTLLETA